MVRARALERQLTLTAQGAIGSTSRVIFWPGPRGARRVSPIAVSFQIRSFGMYKLIHQPQAAIGAVSVTGFYDLKYTSGSLVSVAVGWTSRKRAPAPGPHA